ncbi:MAG: tetratricopeptide repeat protein [Saprospiraceae bacterium]
MAKKNTPNRPQTTQSQPKRTATIATAQPANAWEPAGWLMPTLVMLGLAALIYAPSVFHEYVNWDDAPNIAENPNLQHINAQSIANIFSLDKGNVIGNYNPLPILTFGIEKMLLGKFDPHFTHLINLLLHLGTVFFVVRFLLHLGIGRNGALLGGALFAIHPMRVESVAWATERKDVLFAIFFFAALMYYVRWVRTAASERRVGTYLVIVLLAALAHLSKVQAVTLVLSMYLVDFWVGRKWDVQSFIVEKLPFGIMALLIGLANIHTLNTTGSTDDITGFSGLQRLCIGSYSFAVYLQKLLIPYPMSPLYPYDQEFPQMAYAAPLVFFGVVGLAIWLYLKKRMPALVFAIGFFLFNVVFLLQWKPAGQGFLADRFTYVPYFGFFFLAAWLWDKTERENPARLPTLRGVFGAALAVFALLTWRQIKIWENGETLWSHVIKFEGTSISLAWGNRAHYYREKGAFEQSLADYTKALQINPKANEHYNSRGKTQFDMAMSGKYKGRQRDLVEKAIADYTTGLGGANLKPKDRSEILANRGAALAALGQNEAALQDLNEAIKLEPENKNSYMNRSLLWYNFNRYDMAVADLTKILELDPYNHTIYYERGLSKNALKDFQGAIADLTKSIELNPDQHLAYFERARAQSLLGNKTAARQDIALARQHGLKIPDSELHQIGL